MTSPRRALGIDIGGTKIAVAAVDETGTIHAQEAIATEAELGFQRAVRSIVAAGDRVLMAAGWTRDQLCGIGVGCTGPVSAERGIINNPYTLPTWNNCDIVSPLRDAFDRPAYLENDADAAALGEWFAGAAHGCSRAVMLTLGTGVGGGVILDGGVYRGTRGEHPELGHMPIEERGAECYCGTRGCLESIASGTGIAAAGNAEGWHDSRAVFAAAESGSAAAQQILDRVSRALATATWTVLHTFMPEVIVLGGGIGELYYDLFAPAMAARIPCATMVPAGGTRVVKAALGNDAGLVGAACLALARQRTK